MQQFANAEILILAGRPDAARRWAEMLRGHHTQVWLSPAQIPDSGLPEVIVTDGQTSQTRPPVGSGGYGPPAIVGTVRIGGSGPADVELPEDVDPPQLRLVCRMLAEIVRLRRREHLGTELQQQLSEQALTDPLTGLPNRRAWDRALRDRLTTLDRSPLPASRRLCLAIFDLDHFKQVNDAQGHRVGDDVLRAAGQAIRQGLREHDFVARLGGDEFGLLLWIPDQPMAAAVVERVRTSLPAQISQTSSAKVTASAGYCLVRSAESCQSPPSADTLFAVADAALHEAKRQGRDRAVGE